MNSMKCPSADCAAGVACRTAEEDVQPAAERNAGVANQLSILDRWLALWVVLAMGIGLLLGNVVDGITEAFNVATIIGVSLPIAFGLWLMMFPILAQVRYELLGSLLSSRGMSTQLLLSLGVNWIIGPMLMTGLAWATLPDLPEYRDGVILVGIARCIAMVLIWNHLAEGDAEMGAVLVAINSIMQVFLYAPMTVLFLSVISGRRSDDLSIEELMKEVAQSVGMFLGVPLLGGVAFRYAMIAIGNRVVRHAGEQEREQGKETGEQQQTGQEWFTERVMPWVEPWATIALLYTILIMFAMQGKQVTANFGNFVRAGVPMLLYFSIVWSGTFVLLWRLGSSYERAVTQAFTASSNNFELAIAIAVATYGITSKQALAATVGPLMEVPVLLSLVYVALWLRPKMTFGRDGVPVV